MLSSRIIPFLLIKNGGLYKTENFTNAKYVGDPLNAVKIFNEKFVDEIVVLDIDATVKYKEPNYKLISNIARECRMPLCYGGGIKDVDQIEKIISLGVEKVALSSSIIDNPELITSASKRVGSQSIVAVLDIKKYGVFSNYGLYINNGKIRCKKDPLIFAKEISSLGVGEFVINSIDCDGTQKGYDLKLIDMIKLKIPNIPITFIGGAGSISDIKMLLKRHYPIAAGAGSLFVFKGKYKAVLINYPSPSEKKLLLNSLQF